MIIDFKGIFVPNEDIYYSIFIVDVETYKLIVGYEPMKIRDLRQEELNMFDDLKYKNYDDYENANNILKDKVELYSYDLIYSDKIIPLLEEDLGIMVEKLNKIGNICNVNFKVMIY